nr:SUMF1/EgtB/PvdO family nonheme iron enzyme [Treponema socranskii]
MKSKVRMFLAAASALIVLFGMTGCPQSQSGGETIMIDITVKGDANVNVPADPVQVTLGSQWSTVKAILTPNVTAKTGWLIDSWHPGEDASQPEIDNAKIFYGDETVFVKSRPILPPLPKPAKPGDPSVKITFEVASEAGKILGDNPVIVRPNTTWADLKDYAKAALKTNYGFSEESVQWKQGSAPLTDGTSFAADATITAYPKDIRIRIKVTGDGNVTIDKADEKIIAIPGTKWKNIKAKADDKVRVKDKDRYVVTAWHKGTDKNGPKLTNDYAFQESDGPECTVFAKTSDSQITLTVNYGTGSGTPTTGGTITIRDGNTWASVKAQAAGKVNIPQDHIIQEWRLDGKSGQVINDSYKFKASDGNARTVYAELQNQKIKVTVKYGKLEGAVEMLPEPIIVLNGKKWSEVADEFEAKVNAKLPQDFEIDSWIWDNDNGLAMSPEHTFKTENAPYTVYARLKDKRIKVTIKYGKLKGGEDTVSVPLTVLEGKTWGEVKEAAKAKIPASASVLNHAAVSEWRWDNADGNAIDDRETFYVDDGQTRTVYALIRSKITISTTTQDRKLTYYAPIGGTVTECSYGLKGLAEASGTVGDNSQTDNREHTVTLSAYKIGEIEISQALYELVMGENPSHFKPLNGHQSASDETQERRPVENLTWREAVLFCNELTLCTGIKEKDGKDARVYVLNHHPYTMKDVKAGRDPGIDINKRGFRLPTEAEWEWAAQGGSARHKWAGTDSSGQLGTYAWYRDNSDNKTREVKKKASNAFGLYDMSGNVWEWCWDWYDNLPASGLNPMKVLSGNSHVIRGGGYGEHWSDCRCAVRQSMNQDHPKVGFRIVSRY